MQGHVYLLGAIHGASLPTAASVLLVGYDNDNNAIGKPWVIFLLGEKSYKDVISDN
jgi:hypothetical protein